MSENVTDEEFKGVLTNFYNTLASSQEPLELEFQKVLNDNYWDLITESNKDK